MSLINQMLKDIDLRKQGDGARHGTYVRPVGTPARQVTGSRNYDSLILLVLGFLLLLVAFNWWYINHSRNADLEQKIETVSLPAIPELADNNQNISHQETSPASVEPSTPTVRPSPVLPSTAQSKFPGDIKPEHNTALLQQKMPEVLPKEVPSTHTERPLTHFEGNSNTARTAASANSVTSKAITSPAIVRVADNRPLRNDSNGIQKTFRPLKPSEVAESSFQQGMGLLSKGRRSEAISALQNALVQYPPHIKARELLAGIMLKQGNREEAFRVLSDGFEINPQHSLNTKLYARMVLEDGDDARALEILEKGKPSIYDDPDYFALMAAVHQRMGNYRQAITIYRILVKVQPNNSLWWMGLAIAFEGDLQFPAAIEAYQKARNSGRMDDDLLRFLDNRIVTLKRSSRTKANQE